jgi:putative N6-adenine-specific DNA methylase
MIANHNSTDALRIYISCSPGLESCLSAECAGLGLTAASPRQVKQPGKALPGEEPGGLELEGTLEDIYRCNLHLRTASRVVVRLGEFNAIGFAELRKKAARLEWETFLKPGKPVQVRVTCHKSRLYHSDAVAERVLGAINDHFIRPGKHAKPIEVSPQGQLVLVRLVDDHCTISVDSSGELLHRRGYRLASAKAPLRETLAAGLLMLAGWDRASPLIDPFCGAGTIPIEAALMARSIPPGIARKFGFMDWQAFDPDLWDAVLVEARAAIKESNYQIIGSDRDAGAIEMAAANAARAGQKGRLDFRCQAISFLEPAPTSGWIVTNPPYGVRVQGGKDLRDLYARFGSLLKERFGGWKVAVVSNDERLLGNMGLGKPMAVHGLVNGGIAVRLGVYEV